MTTLTDCIDRTSQATRPVGRAIGYHKWRNLLFAHWQVPVEEIKQLIPDSLTVDTYNGMVFIGLVPFEMHGIRPWWSPAIPGISSFFETNVRTYVHRDGKDPGVWFCSLDASSNLAVRVARWGWHLPYYHSEMSVTKANQQIQYHCKRLEGDHKGNGTNIKIEYGDLVEHTTDTISPGRPKPGTLEHWFAERYILYSEKRDGTILSGHVHHKPYEVREVQLINMEESLLAANDVTVSNEPEHLLFCEGVDVEVFPLRPVE